MFSAVFPKIGNSRFVRALSAFYRSLVYPIIIVALMVVSEIFALEIPVYCVYVVLAALCLLFADDATGVLPIFCCSYMTVSPLNFPGPELKEEIPAGTVSLFAVDWALILIISLCVISLILMIGRLVVGGICSGKRQKAPALTVGFIALGIAYLISGVGSPDYSLAEALVALLEIVSLCITYFYFYYTVDWEKTPKWYIPALFVCIGVGLLFQIANMYTFPGAIVDGKVVRDYLFTGWGTYNNVGCIMAMCIPAAAYFSIRGRHGWIATVLSCLFMGGVFLTQSRGSMLFGGVVFVITAVCVLVFGGRKGRIPNIIVYGIVLAAAVVVVIIGWDSLFVLFQNKGFSDSGRFTIYRNCLEKGFLPYPVLGRGFYGTGAIGNPDRVPEGIPFFAHNTFVQLLSTGGVVLLLVYLFHRFQTVRLLFSPFTPEKLFLGLCILSMLLTSMLDVHVFSFGPGLLYGVLLLAMEKFTPVTPRKRLFLKKKKD